MNTSCEIHSLLDHLEKEETYLNKENTSLWDSFNRFDILDYDESILHKVMNFKETLKPDGTPYKSQKYLAYSIVRSCVYGLYNTYSLGDKTQAEIKNNSIYQQINSKVCSFLTHGLTSLNDMDKIDRYFTDYHVAYTMITEERLPTGINYGNIISRFGTNMNGHIFKFLEPHNLFLVNKAMAQSLLLPTDVPISNTVLYSTCATLFEHYDSYSPAQKAALLINTYMSLQKESGSQGSARLSGLIGPKNKSAQTDLDKIKHLESLGFDNLSRGQLEEVLSHNPDADYKMSGNFTLSI